MNTKKRTKVLIVDDHSIVRFGMQSLLARRPDILVCGEAEDYSSAITVFRKEKPDIVLVDISIEGNGLELTKQMVKMNPQVKVIVVSMHDEAVYADRALKAGAKGYLMKRDASRLLLNVVLDTVLRGDIYLSEGMTRNFIAKMARSGNESSTSPEDTLSDRELEIFSLIGQGHDTKDISVKLKISPKTVETHRDHIKQKLGIKMAKHLKTMAVAWSKSNQM